MLRPYQNYALNEIVRKFDSGTKSICLCMPTGSGKTYTFTEYAKEYYATYAMPVLILVHRFELLNQAKNSLGEKCFIINSKAKYIPNDYAYYVGMVESSHRRELIMPEFGLLIIDEAHIGNFKKLKIRHRHKIGVTATPLTTPPLSEQYEEIICPVSIEELIEQSHLCNAKSYGFKQDEFAIAVQSWSIKNGEYTDKDQLNFYKQQKMVKGVLDAYWKIAPGKKTLVFNVNKEHCLLVHDAFIQECLPSKTLLGDTPEQERKDILNWFARTPDAIINSVGVLTTGFDEPSIYNIILNRSTLSLNLYLQMVGRGSRLFEDKQHFNIIDLGRNVVRHNMYDYPHDWVHYFKHGKAKRAKKDEAGAPAVKTCPKCEALIPTSTKTCKYCGHSFAKTPEEEKAFELAEYVRSKPIKIPEEKIYETANTRQWKPYAVLYKIGEHLLSYQAKSNGKINDEYINTMMLDYLQGWCKRYEKRFNDWHKDYAINKVLKELRNPIKPELQAIPEQPIQYDLFTEMFKLHGGN